MNQQDLDYLQHYGVLGMKWGVRRQRSRQKRFTKKAAKAKKNIEYEKKEIETAKAHLNEASRAKIKNTANLNRAKYGVASAETSLRRMEENPPLFFGKRKVKAAKQQLESSQKELESAMVEGLKYDSLISEASANIVKGQEAIANYEYKAERYLKKADVAKGKLAIKEAKLNELLSQQSQTLKKKLKHSDDDYLQHYGVPGMKWGVRKRKPPTGTRHKKSTSTASLSKQRRTKMNTRLAEIRKRQMARMKTLGTSMQNSRKEKLARKAELKRREYLMKTPVNKLTTAELNERIRRSEIENQAKDSLRVKKSGTQKIVEKAISDSSSKILSKVIETGVNSAVKSSFGIDLGLGGKKVDIKKFTGTVESSSSQNESKKYNKGSGSNDNKFSKAETTTPKPKSGISESQQEAIKGMVNAVRKSNILSLPYNEYEDKER